MTHGKSSSKLHSSSYGTANTSPASAADSPDFSTPSTSTPYPLSCPATSLNTKCFPITEDPLHWEDIFSPSLFDSERDPQVQLELRRTRKRNTITGSKPSAYNARSVTLKWPDRMRHAVFYMDDRCQVTDTGSGESVRWHIEREGLRSEDCVGFEQEGRWGSVEFMREDEWAVWDRRRRGVDDGSASGGWGWRGLL